MIIYSVIVKVKSEIASEWLQWMKEEHIPHVLKTRYFNNHTIFRVLVPETETGFITYKISFELDSFAKYNEYVQKEAKRLQEEVAIKYDDKFTASREVIEKI